MIGLVIDSASQIIAELRDRFAVQVVPVTVIVDGVPHLEGDEIDVAGITAALNRGAKMSTAAPSPGQFLRAYRQAAAAGATAVVSVHTGGGASSTANSARLAAASAPLPVEVVDTATASFPVTLSLWAAADVLATGGSVAQAASAARRTATEVDNVFVVGTLALAAAGGRLAPHVATVDLPVLALTDGVMRAVGSAESPEQAVKAMADYVSARSGGRRLRLGVGHLGAEPLAERLEHVLRRRVDVEQLIRYEVGPSIAVHTGLGTVGCVFCPV